MQFQINATQRNEFHSSEDKKNTAYSNVKKYGNKPQNPRGADKLNLGNI